MNTSTQTESTPAAPITIGDWLRSAEMTRPLERIRTGYPELDGALNGGFVPGNFYILAGMTSTGKSALAANIARRMSLGGVRVHMNSLEDSPIHFVRMLVAAAAQVPVDNVELLAFTEAQKTKFGPAIRLLHDLPLLVQETAGLDKLQTLILAHAAQGTRVFIIDQLSHVRHEAGDAFERAAAVSRVVQGLAKQTKSVILLLAQINRTGSQRSLGPTLYDLRDSGTLEQDARGVLLIKNLEIHGDKGILTVEIAKHTFGPRGQQVKLTFFLKEQRMESYVPSDVTGRR